MKLQQITEQLKVVVILLINHHQVVFEYPNAWVEDVVRHCDVLSQSGCAKKAGQTLKSRSVSIFKIDSNVLQRK